MEDFEKGLMLLGLLTPQSTEEIEEKHEYDSARNVSPSKKQNTYFKRVVLAAEIVSNLRLERTFGRVKFQKMVYMCEHLVEMGLASRYAKFAAGPFDNKFMHSINKEFMKHNWFEAQQIQEGEYNVVRYYPLPNHSDYKRYYEGYFSNCDKSIHLLIDFFRHKKTDETEIAATTLACVLELNKNDKHVKKEELLKLFYGWHDKKGRFSNNQIINSLDDLKKVGLLPIDLVIE